MCEVLCLNNPPITGTSQDPANPIIMAISFRLNRTNNGEFCCWGISERDGDCLSFWLQRREGSCIILARQDGGLNYDNAGIDRSKLPLKFGL